MHVPNRLCNAQAVEDALPGISGVPPEVLIAVNCNSQLNNLGQQAQQASTNATDPPIDTAPAVTGTDQAANAAGTNGNVSPLTFIATALGNLGLINGQGGNDGYAPTEAAQMVSTIATFDQVEADLAGILATASGEGASLGITGDIALLQQVDSRLEAVTTAENLLFGGDAKWLDTNQAATLQQWMTAFFTDAQNSSDGSGTISSAEITQLLATTLPSTVSTSEAMEFLDRWNLTVQYWSQGIFTAAQVPAGQSTDFIDIDAIRTAFNAAVTAEQESQANGYSDTGTEVQAALKQVQSDLAGQGTCATIKLQIGESATLTRSAFSGTLTITNSEGTGAMTNVAMDINITDAEGNPANGEFYVSSPTYSGAFSVVNGNATLPDYSTGTISFTFIPDDSAASNGPTQYNIGGTIGFTDPSGGAVTIPVFPSIITVNPQASLQLNYFLQTDVIGADPFTPQVVIPSEPAVLGLLVTNVGGGTANNLSITTAQPQIVQNEKGLLDTFQIIGTHVGNQQETPSLTVNFGDIAPGQTADASFLLESSLEGVFEDFTATFSHSDALGGTETSLISSVVTHTLVHAGDFNYPDSTGATDYLVDDNPNPQQLPDTIYFSDGTTTAVNIATNATSSPVGSSGDLTFQVTANVTSGWDYIQIPDPGAGYTLYKVVRSDGTVIPVSDQAWTTDRTISPTGRSTVDYVLHILDDNSTGSYLVYYKPTTATPPAVSSLSTVSSPQSGPVGPIDVTFSEPIDPSTFTTANLSLTLNGGPNLVNSSVTITQDSPTTYTIGGLSALTTDDGNYSLTVSATGISDFFGDAGSGSLSTSWATGTDVPVVVSVGAGNPTLRNTPVDTVDVVLSEPIVAGSFDYQAISLTLDGGPNLITSGVTVTEINPTTYSIGGLGTLTAADGDYVLTVSAAGLVDGSGHSGVGALAETWTMNTVGPTIASLPTYIQSPRNIVVPSIDVIFSEPIVPSTFTYQDITYSKAGGPNLITPSITIAQLSPTEFEISNFNNLISPIDGTYTFTVSAAGVMDLAGNTGSGSASDTWVLSTAAPAAPTDLAIAPNTGATPGLTDTGLVTLTGTLSESGLAVDVADGNTDLGFATVNGTSFSIALNLPAGANQLEVTADDAAGNVSPSSTFNVFVEETPPTISSVAAVTPNPRNTPVDSVDVTFSKAINPSTFTTADLSLSDNGGPNLITSAVTINLVSGTTYEIGGLSGLTTAEGTYMLTVNASGIQDQVGNFGTGSMSASWLMDTTPPTSTVGSLPAQTTSTSFLVSASGTDPNGSNGSAPSGIASFALYVSVDGGAFTAFATVTPANPSALFTGQPGHTYGFYSVATDNAGNVQPIPSGAQATTEVVGAAVDTTMSLQSSEDPSKLGDSVTFTATVSPAQSTNGTPTGTVQFSIDGAADGNPVSLDANGLATLTISSLAVGSHTVAASYVNADGNFNDSSTTLAGGQIVTTADTTVAVTSSSSAPTSVFGQSVTFTVTVSGVTAGLPTPTGTVELFDGATELGTASLNSGSATYSTAALAVGAHAITAQYLGDGNFSGKTSPVVSQTVGQAGTTTSLAANPASSVFGQSVTFTASIGVVFPGAGIPTDTVAFKEGSTTLGTETLGSSGTVSFTTSALAVGSNTITAVYSGDPNFVTSSSSTTETVNQAGTTTHLSASPSSTSSGQTVTLTATIAVVAPGAGTPTGSVQFFDGTTPLGTANLSGNTAILTTTTLPVGTDSLTAKYLGDPNFTVSTSSAVSVTISPTGIATKTTLTSSTNPSVFGQSVTFTATVAPSSGSGSPSGSVTFYAGSTPLGTATVSSKKASLKTTSVPVGSQAITAVYSGDTNYAPSTSAVLSQTVNQDSTTSTAKSSANPSVYGQSVTYTATVKAASPGSGTPTGKVTFYDGTTNLGNGTLSGGTATLPTTFFIIGSHSITAVYAGDPDFTTSTASALSQTVNQAGTTTAVVSLVDQSIYGQQLTFTATVSANSPGSGTPSGTITFYSGSTQLGTGTLSDGTASLTTSPLLSVGNHTIKASYSGDTSFKTSAGTVVQTVNQDNTTTSLASSTNASVYGQSVTYTATVVANAPGSGTPTGSVTFMNGSTTLGTVTLSGGTASYSTAKLATGLDMITATYNGSSSFITSNASLNQTVSQDAASAIVTSSLNPSVYGQSVTFTAIVSAAAPGSGTPTGTVTFMDGSTTLNTATLNASGKATFKTSALLAGSHSITVVYDGDTNFVTSTAPALSQTINLDATTTKLSSSDSSSVYGESVTFTSTVKAASPGSGTPTGTVTFMDGSSTLGTGTLDGTGTATFTVSSLSVGTHAITAVYGGDSNFSAKASATLNQVVKLAQTTTSMVSVPNPSSAGQAVTFTATIGVVAPGSGTPTGIVTFLDGTTTLGTATLNGETATLTTASLTVGTHSIKAVYGGDPNFNGSTSTVLKQVVNTSSSSPMSLSAILPVDPVDQAIASLQDDTTDDLVIQDLAMEQVQSKKS
ncbi:MAG: beta strand repeat-containing protein [Isosphaeraceae bacterium]